MEVIKLLVQQGEHSVGAVLSFCSVAKLRLNLCSPMECRMPGSPVHHYLLEFADSCLLSWKSESEVTQSCPTPITPWTVTYQASPSMWFSRQEYWSGMPSNHLNLCYHLLWLPSVLPSIRVFSNECTLCIMWPKYWSFSSASVLTVNIQGWFPLGLTGLISLQYNGLSRVFSNTTVQKLQFFSAQPSLWSNSHIHIWLLEKP